MNELSRRRMVKLLGATGAAGVTAGCLSDGEASPNGENGNGGNSEPQPSLDDPMSPDVDTIAADPTDVPDPVDWDEPRHHEIHMQTEEHIAEVEDGVTHRFMTFDGQVPGPMVRVREGDTIHLTFEVPDDLNEHLHNVDFHATYGPGGGAEHTTLLPGDGPAEIEFKAKYPGAHIYHCAPGNHDYHISTGMFGTILVEPEDGLPEVDREFYVGQHELYTNGDNGEEGHHEWDPESAKSEDPTYVLFNGEAGRYTGENAIHAEVGETVRLFWCNGGPNHVSTPHPIGNVWKRWYDHGNVVNEPMKWVEGATLGAGMTGFGDMQLPVPGPIHLVDHALTRVVQKDFLATIEVEGEQQPDIYDPDPDGAPDAGEGEAY